MRFYEQLNQYMKAVNCTAKELCIVSGISAAALSRYLVPVNVCRMFIRKRLNSFALPLKRSH